VTRHFEHGNTDPAHVREVLIAVVVMHDRRGDLRRERAELDSHLPMQGHFRLLLDRRLDTARPAVRHAARGGQQKR